MKVKIMLGYLLLSCSFINTAATLKQGSTPTDPGVINKPAILYWMMQRGELSTNATDEEKRQAIAHYLGNKSFSTKKLPGQYGKQYMFEQSMAYHKIQNAKRNQSTGKHNALAINRTARANAITEAKVLAIMIDFSDLQANINEYPVAHYNNLLFSNTGDAQDITSVYKYYQAESGGTLNFTGSVNGWVRAEHEAAYYGENDPDNNDSDKNVPDLILEAVTKAVADLNINLEDYDLDNDGIIDHVMVFHSSVGEEAGGGSLAEDAIWSHSYVVVDEQNQPVSVPGSTVKLYGYTINPLDARIGVVSHEFGHDLGVPDEYDVDSGTFGSPVADWSLMASGSWVDGGSHPSGFSPYVKDYYQTRYGGNWINQQEITFAELTSETVDLVSATDHSLGKINQLKVNLPPKLTEFIPYAGDYQYYSSQGHNLNSILSFDVSLPSGSSQLTMKAHWKIETDWDYVVVKVNDTVIAGNHTTANNPLAELPNVHDYLSSASLLIDGAEGELGWVDLIFDLSAYENQSVTIKIEYITDTYVDEYGLVVDELNVVNGEQVVFSANGETPNQVTLSGGFTRSEAWSLEGKPRHYYLQLRQHNVTDKFLKNENYDHGLLLWYRDEGVADNRVNSHPGEVFIGVVDADQHPIKQGNSYRNTYAQISDAAFSLYDQSVMVNGDSLLSAVSIFDDKLDYSAPYQPESGIKLPKLGFTMEIATQESNSSAASIILTKSSLSYIEAEHSGLSVSFTAIADDVIAESSYVWQMGDNTSLSGVNVTHIYAQAGEFNVSVTYQTSSGDKTLDYLVVVGDPIEGSFSVNVSAKQAVFTPELTGGFGDFSYRWDFGDSTEISSEMSPTHDYQQSGNYTVTLTVVDATSQSFLFTKQVTIENALSASISQSVKNLTVNFSSTVTGGDDSYTYAWDFGDNSAVNSSANPSHSYAVAGSYQVKLTVTDGTGKTVEASTTVNVTAPVVTPPVTKAKSSGGGGASWGLLMIIGAMLMRRTKS